MWIPLIAGVLFGLGLAVSNMINPDRVLAFLDVLGDWDPTLVFVMMGAVAVTMPGFWWALKRDRPWRADAFALPTKREIDSPLIVGAVLFGMGWGLAGLCPGPALAALVSLDMNVVGFCAVMVSSWRAAHQVMEKWF